MDARRWSNVTRARLAHASGAAVAAMSPIQAYLEVSARCNLRCTMCAIGYDDRYASSSGRPPYLNPELFARLRPIFPSLLRAYLFGLGEPLLNPHLTGYIRELAGVGVDVAFTTNATLIDDTKADELAKAGVRHVTVSIDGARAETYEAIRIGASFARVLRGIRALVAAGKRHGRPTVSLSIVAMRSNLDDLPALVALCADEGAIALHVEPLLAQVAGTALDAHYAREHLGLVDPAHVRATLGAAQSLAATRGIRFGSRLTHAQNQFDYVKSVAAHADRRWLCSEPWATVWVTVAGEVRTCCLNDASFGSLADAPFDAVWSGEQYRQFRAQHARGETPAGCENCIRNGRVQGSEFFDAIEEVTYRPYFDAFHPPSPDDAAFLEDPVHDASVREPLYVRGLLRDGIAARDVTVMIDQTPVEMLSTARFTGRSFRVFVPTHFLSEGAHVVWLRDSAGRGCAHRRIHFWRPSV